MLVGRKKEIEIIKESLNSNQNEFVAIYGRRRVGKTYLVNSFFNDEFDFKFTGIYKSTTKINLKQFQNKLNTYTKINSKTPGDWFEAFDNLKNYLISLNKNNVIIFIDELPWLDTNKSNFINAFANFYNTFDNKKIKLKLFVCGSATTWMLNKLIGDKGGLHGRVTRQIHLSPFSLTEVKEYLNIEKGMNLNNKQILDYYMILGGIPYYYNMLEKNKPFNVNIDELFFDENGPLKLEYQTLIESLFNNGDNYRKIIEALSTKMYGLTREEIIKITKIDGGYLSTILKNLIKCDFIKVYNSPNKKEKNCIYQLVDLYLMFYLRFVSKDSGQDHSFFTHMLNGGELNAWHGYAFEKVCLLHIDNIKKALGINGILTTAYSFKNDKIQIDLIIDRNDDCMNICEIKYSNNKYIIDSKYEEKIRERLFIFKNEIKTKKNLLSTFITIYGTNNSSVVDNSLTLDDLFI